MSTTIKKRAYNSGHRQAQSEQARQRILRSAKKLFEIKGFEAVTIEAIANKAKVSVPTVYSKFKSKQGILLTIIDSALSEEQHQALVSKVYTANSATKQLQLAAKISRKLYDAEFQQMDWARGATVIDPIFQKLEKEREERRYLRQKKTIEIMSKQKVFRKTISKNKARDLLWAYTGRDLYRMFVIERNWSSNVYEKWLSDTLIELLLEKNQ